MCGLRKHLINKFMFTSLTSRAKNNVSRRYYLLQPRGHLKKLRNSVSDMSDETTWRVFCGDVSEGDAVRKELVVKVLLPCHL